MLNKINSLSVSHSKIPPGYPRNIETNRDIIPVTQQDQLILNNNSVQQLYKKLISFAGRIFSNTTIPTVVLIDRFHGQKYDINGDRIPDLTHGNIIQLISKSIYPKSDIMTLDVSDNYDYSLDHTLNNIESAFNEVENQVKNGKKINAVNMSLGINYSYDDLAFFTGIPVTQENFHLYKKDIRNFFNNPDIPEKVEELSNSNRQAKEELDKFKLIAEKVTKVLKSIEETTKQGIPVYIPAGDNGPDYINLFTLANDCISVGSYNAEGKKSPFSADNKLVNFEQGVFNITPVSHDNLLLGYDITGSGNVEIPARLVSDQEPVIKQFTGKKAGDIIANNEDYKEIFKPGKISPKSLNKLYPIDVLANIHQINPIQAKTLKSMGWLADYYLTHALKVDKNKRIVYDPDGSHRSKAVHEIHGPSLSSPIAMMKDLKQKFMNLNTTKE